MALYVKNICAIEGIDSRGYPTVICKTTMSDGAVGIASVPSGASTGKFEAHELRDCDNCFGGKGVKKAVENVNSVIAPEIVALQSACQKKIDDKMIALDSSENKSTLGANAILWFCMKHPDAYCAEALNQKFVGGVLMETATFTTKPHATLE